AITAPLVPNVIVAGAGSGKTTVMAARVVWLVGSGQVRADEVLGLTFTNKAAAELGLRVRGALDTAGLLGRPDDRPPGEGDEADQGEPTVATYHAYAGRLISEHGLRLGFEPDTGLLADASRFQLAAMACEQYPGSLAQVSTHLPTTLAGVLKLEAEMSEHLVSPDAVRQFDEALRGELAAVPKQLKLVLDAVRTTHKRDELVALVEAYRRLKTSRGVMDFSDQMAVGARLAQECPEVGVLERDRYRVVLLDEYQDTSVAQRLMLSGLFAGDASPDGRGHPVTAVGDPCQGIYGWRGASVTNLDEYPQHFVQADDTPTPTYPLSVNRRSGSRILDVANAHATELYATHRGVEPLVAPADAPAGSVRVALFERYADEMAWVASQVAAVPTVHPGVAWSEVGVLVHRMADARALQVELRGHDVPVEVVGLGGLLSRPEVADVVATLEVVHDLTANAAMLRLLTGPRWRIGPRDLALLGDRARHLAAVERSPRSTDLAVALEQAVAGVDLTEIVSLADALDDPGKGDYSPEALDRFAQLTREIRRLRAFAGEPLVDLVRRVIDVIGVDIELVASPGAVAAQARDNLASFVDAVATFAGNDGDASLHSLIAYLKAEDDYAQGLPVASPTESNSVKLMTVHKAKGLEWDVVFVPELTETVFPSALGRPRWTSNAEALPSPLRGDADTLPELLEWTTAGDRAFRADSAAHEGLEERRLGYVAFTRARRALVVSGAWWGPTQKKKRGPSDYLKHLHHLVGDTADPWCAEPADDDNPYLGDERTSPWPAPLDADAVRRRMDAARLLAEARTRHEHSGSYDADDELLLDHAAMVADWDATVDRLVDEARRARLTDREVELPRSLSATTVLRLQSDPAGLARDLARPMPRRPSPAARFGTRFHAWVEAYVGQQQMLDPADIPGAADEGIDNDADLRALCQAFADGPFGERAPHRVEAPFALALAGEVVRGRIDAVYAEGDGYRVVDWKTNQQQTADPLQLAIYRLAWAELTGVPVEQVSGSFYYVRSGELVTPADLLGRKEIERLLLLESPG
ncbi:MAG: AAA family ATPase, partial [Propionibacteriales bacterium]|nr:AAA family ATPase [Propionibacteriales bacterium]